MLVTILSIAEVAYILFLGVWIVLEKRSPVATLAWVLLLALLPVVGFFVYVFLGPRRVSRRRLRRSLARRKVRGDDGPVPSLSSHALEEIAGFDLRRRQIMELAFRATEMPPTRAEDVTILRNGVECYAAMEEAILGARHHVHLCYYILTEGGAGARLRDLLVRRAREGIEVRVLVDAMGSFLLGRRFFRPLREAGVECARFNNVGMARLRPYVNFRNHRKILVVDGRVGFTGGINIDDVNLAEGARRPWRDTHVRLVGSAVRGLQLVFLEDWHFATGASPRGRAEYFPPPRAPEPNWVQVLASGPDADLEAIEKVYFATIATAERRLLVATPYFVPDEAIVMALVTAALRGVDVQLLVPRASDSRVVSAAARSYYDELLAAGVRVFEYMPGMHHAKILVVDDVLSVVGSANLDNRSFRLNFEAAVVLYGESHARVLTEQFAVDRRDCREVTRASREGLAIAGRFAEAGARLLSPVL